MKKDRLPVNSKIHHRRILEESGHFSQLIDTYREKILTQQTRTIRLLGRKSSAKILHTLLGYEVQASYKRIQCPDLVTARYLRLFSELGCHSIKLPYDPTLTGQIIPEFESTVESIKETVRRRFPRDESTQQYVIRKLYGLIRHQLASG